MPDLVTTAAAYPRALLQPEDGFEDVQLDDDVRPLSNDEVWVPPPRRRGLFSRFGGADSGGGDGAVVSEPGGRSSGRHHGSSFAGRKRAQSNQGSEMASVPLATSRDGY